MRSPSPRRRATADASSSASSSTDDASSAASAANPSASSTARSSQTSGSSQASASSSSNSSRGGRAPGSQTYNDQDIEALLDIVQELRPLGADQWQNVADRYNRGAASRERAQRDADSLRKKFNGLCRHKKPTGDPQCPPLVKRAKRIQRDIEESANVNEIDDYDHGESDTQYTWENSIPGSPPAFNDLDDDTDERSQRPDVPPTPPRRPRSPP